jgi:DNA-binding IclR family transcriptional regulator
LRVSLTTAYHRNALTCRHESDTSPTNGLSTMAMQTARHHSSDNASPAVGARRTANAGASEKTLMVLEAALTHSRFTDVVEETGLAKATTHRILGTLVNRRFVTVDVNGNYLPGPKILSLAGLALQRTDISAIAKPFVNELVAKTHCTVHLGVANGDEIIYLVRADSDRPYVMPSRVGLAIPMHSTGIGKVVLGSWTDDELERFVARAGLPARKEHTITSLPALRSEVTHVRRLGYALDREENVPGLGCVAAPIRDHTGTVKYGISVSTLLIEHTPEQIEAMSGMTVETADKISDALGYQL